MPSEKNKWIDAVGKLISLTQERKLLWRPTDTYDSYEVEYGGKLLRLHWSRERNEDDPFIRLALMDRQTGVEWAFPYSVANEHLMEAVRYQLVGAGDFIDELLTHAV